MRVPLGPRDWLLSIHWYGCPSPWFLISGPVRDSVAATLKAKLARVNRLLDTMTPLLRMTARVVDYTGARVRL